MKKISEISPRSQIVFLILIVLITRLGLAWVFGSEVADIAQTHDAADIVARGENIYQAPQILFPYTPIPMFLPSWSLDLAHVLGIPFHFVMKWPMILADVGIALLLWWQTRKRGLGKAAVFVGLGYALNPVSILITSFHGSSIVLSAFFSLLAYCLVANDFNFQKYRLSALSLGLAIGLRAFPILYLPFFIRKIDADLRHKVLYIFLAVAPTLVTIVPFLVVDFQSVWKQLLTYSGLTDYGWMAIARAAWFLIDGNRYLPGTLGITLLTVSKFCFVLVYALFVGLFWWKTKRFSLLGGLLITLLLFLVVYGGISSQYLIWVVPFALCVGTKWEIAYSWSATFALVSFYLFYFPTILFGNLHIVWTDMNPAVMNLILVANVIFWSVCTAWVIQLIAHPSPDPVLDNKIITDQSIALHGESSQ